MKDRGIEKLEVYLEKERQNIELSFSGGGGGGNREMSLGASRQLSVRINSAMSPVFLMNSVIYFSLSGHEYSACSDYTRL